MKEYLCKTNYYNNGVLFALKGDTVVVLNDYVITNTRTNDTCDTPEILEDAEYFIPIFSLKNKESDRVNHPSHYTWLKKKCGIEVIDITRHLDFNKGNAVKYLLRSGYKSEEGYDDTQKEIEDLEKAIWYIEDKIKTLKNGNTSSM